MKLTRSVKSNMPERSRYIQIITTTEKKEDAERIAETLVEQRLAACVQIIGPISSVYRWKGRIERTGEYLCLIKSRNDLYERIEKAIKEIHPYEVPEIIVVPITKTSSDYLAWLDEETKE